mmetsp:Transcript_53678/g.142740  ORF Transcript_53678/g.142740 Transcript_53678/m.142740 type:complete len:220 (-) Transcript_53678:231-890(-)
MLPAVRSGKMSTFAWPATVPPGAFFAATLGTIAASNCSSPSKSKSTSLSLSNSTASSTFVTSACCADPLVENDKNATFGASPTKAACVAALAIAISHSCAGVGFGITAQSAKVKGLAKLGPGTMRKHEDTALIPGWGPTKRNPARRTSPVVATLPLTAACTKPSESRRAPKITLSLTSRIASSRLTPRLSQTCCTKFSFSDSVREAGDTISIPAEVSSS